MGGEIRTRQKRLTRKTAKRKTARRAKRTVGERFQNLDRSRLAVMPIRECLVPDTLFERGIGNVVISRDVPGRGIAAGFFLVDVYCLGVQDAILAEMWPEKYSEVIEGLSKDGTMEEWDPACAVKLILDAVAYAKGLGLQPHRDYRKAARIIGSNDSEICPKTFQFGKDGKPFYVQGPTRRPWMPTVS